MSDMKWATQYIARLIELSMGSHILLYFRSVNVDCGIVAASKY